MVQGVVVGGWCGGVKLMWEIVTWKSGDVRWSWSTWAGGGGGGGGDDDDDDDDDDNNNNNNNNNTSNDGNTHPIILCRVWPAFATRTLDIRGLKLTSIPAEVLKPSTHCHH